MLLLLALACGYSVQDWWKDLAQAHCQCEYGDIKRSECVDEQMAIYAETPEYAACADEAAPVTRDEVKTWVDNYTSDCRTPYEPAPQPEDPNWAASCAP